MLRGNFSSQIPWVLPLVLYFYRNQLDIAEYTCFCSSDFFQLTQNSSFNYKSPKNSPYTPYASNCIPAERRYSQSQLSIARRCRRTGRRLSWLSCLGLFRLIEVTKRTVRRAHHLAHRGRRPRVAHVDDIVEVDESRLGAVRPCQVPIRAIIEVAVTGCGIKCLPQTPKPVHLSVVYPECWVCW